LKGDSGDKGVDAVITAEHLGTIITQLSNLAKPGPQGVQGLQGVPGLQGQQGVTGPQGAQGPPGFSCCPDKTVVEGQRNAAGQQSIPVYGGTAVLFSATLVGGGGGGSSYSIDTNGNQVGGNGGGSGHLVTAQFIVPTNGLITLNVGSGGKGGRQQDNGNNSGLDGEDTWVKINDVTYLCAYGGGGATDKKGGDGYFGGGGIASGGIGIVKTMVHKSLLETSGKGSGHNPGLRSSESPHTGAGGASSPMHGKGGDGGNAENIHGQHGTFGGGGGGGSLHVGNPQALENMLPMGGNGGDGMIIYSYRVF
jgi:hypothetical protein